MLHEHARCELAPELWAGVSSVLVGLFRGLSLLRGEDGRGCERDGILSDMNRPCLRYVLSRLHVNRSYTILTLADTDQRAAIGLADRKRSAYCMYHPTPTHFRRTTHGEHELCISTRESSGAQLPTPFIQLMSSARESWRIPYKFVAWNRI